MRRTLVPSWIALRGAQGIALLLLVTAAGSGRGDVGEPLRDRPWLKDVARPWCAEHQDRSDLQIVAVEVRFRAEPPLFAKGEGVVVAPIAVDLDGAQRVLAVDSRPPAARTLSAHGIALAAWPYAGRTHRELSYHAAALVQRPARAAVSMPDLGKGFETLATDLAPDAMARSADTEEHSLEKCADFARWAAATAGPPPHSAQVERLVKAVSGRVEQGRRPEDVCAAIRAGRFTSHWAQVAVVMGAREIGVPAFGFAAADAMRVHLVGTFVDGAGWVLMDVDRPQEGWFQGGAPLVTRAPNLGGFAAASHGFWFPQAGAYALGGWGVQPVSATEWAGGLDREARTDVTESRTLSLEEACR